MKMVIIYMGAIGLGGLLVVSNVCQYLSHSSSFGSFVFVF